MSNLILFKFKSNKLLSCFNIYILGYIVIQGFWGVPLWTLFRSLQYKLYMFLIKSQNIQWILRSEYPQAPALYTLPNTKT